MTKNITMEGPKASKATADNSTLVAKKGLVQNGVGKVEVDERIARGYLQVNTGKLAEAVTIFNGLIGEFTPPPIGALLGRGTAFAIAGNLTQAVTDFSAAIEVDKKCYEAWKRRGQARAANGALDSAVADLTESVRLKKDADGLHQRGLVYHKQKNYKRALKDFQDAISLDESNPTNWNHAGICLTTIGQAVKVCRARVHSHTHKDPQPLPKQKERHTRAYTHRHKNFCIQIHIDK